MQSHLHAYHENEMDLETFKLVSLNVRGISNFCKRHQIFTWCRNKNADFTFLHSNEVSEIQWKNEWGVEMIMAHGSPNSRRVAIFSLKVLIIPFGLKF